MLPGGISQSFAYDNIGRLVDSKTRQSTKVRRERRYHWGKADCLLKTEDSCYGTTSYEYSPTGHLQKANYADGTEEHRLSDKVGVSSTTRMDNSSRSTKARTNGGTRSVNAGCMNGIRMGRLRLLSCPIGRTGKSFPAISS